MLRLPAFRMIAPATLAAASRKLRDLGPRASLMAGGTDLIGRMKRRQASPEVVLSLHRARGFSGIRTEGDGLRIGAGTTLAEIAAHPALSRYAALRQAAQSAATPQIRNSATIGGNLCLPPRCSYYDKSALWRQAQGSCLRSGAGACHVAPGASRCMAVYSGDLAAALLALGARVRLASGAGERVIPLEYLFAGDGAAPLVKTPEEIVAAVLLGRAPSRSVYLKLRRRESFDYPSLGVAAAATSRAGGRGRERRIALTGVGPSPVVAGDVQRLLTLARPVENSDFPASYRKRMAAVFVARALAALSEE